MTGHSYVSEMICIADARYARVFYAELLIFVRRLEARAADGVNGSAIAAAGHPKVGNKREARQLVLCSFHDADVHRNRFVAWFPIKDDFVCFRIPKRQRNRTFAPLPGLFGDSKEKNYARFRRDGARIENPNNFKVVLRRFQIRRAKQTGIEKAASGHLFLSLNLSSDRSEEHTSELQSRF